MSDLTNVFTDIADAIRAKTETQITYKPTEMANAINNIETGGVFELTTGKVFSSFNMPVSVPNGVTSMSSCFRDCSNFNQPVTIPNGVTNTANMFANCFNFNYPVTIPNGVTNTANMFAYCSNFNQPVTIPNGVTNTAYMFDVCSKFNYPVTIPNSVTNTAYMFSVCRNFNYPVTIPNSVTNTVAMFSACPNLNQPVTIPHSVTNTVYMFSGCYNFNQPVTIPHSVANATYMFTGCSNFNYPVIIPNSVTNLAFAFNGCTNFGSNIYLYTSLQKTATKNMFYNCNNSLAKHIFTNNTNAFNGTASSNSVTGTPITWTQDGDNYYNTDFNIYIHNVANPYTVLNNADYSFGNGGVDIANISSPAIVFGSGVQNISYAFEGAQIPADTVIFLGDNITEMQGCFYNQQYFNQPITIPSSVQSASGAIQECNNFNSPVIIRNGVKDISKLLFSSVNFDSDIWIPESVNYMEAMLADTAFESGTGVIHISHNIALGDTDNYIYNALVNGEIVITLDPSRILNDY